MVVCMYVCIYVLYYVLVLRLDMLHGPDRRFSVPDFLDSAPSVLLALAQGRFETLVPNQAPPGFPIE